jgi:hypothetical protein
MNDEDWGRLARTMSAMADAPLSIGTPPEFRMEQLIADVTRLVRRSELKLLLIDSLQWITDSEPSGRMSAEFILRRLKTLAETLKIPIIITVHAERFQEQEGVLTANPIEKLMHSGAIERVADVVIMLHRPDQDDREHPRAGEADLMVAKNRNGPTATVTVAYQGHYCRFVHIGLGEYSLFRAEAAAEAQATDHDRELYNRLMGLIPPGGEVIDWLKNNFMLKALPLRHVETITQVTKTMSLEVIGFDDKEVRDRYNDLRAAIDNFCSVGLDYTWTDKGNNWLEVPNEWKDKDLERYKIAMTTIANARDTLVAAYGSFLQICHKNGVDRDADSKH